MKSRVIKFLSSELDFTSYSGARWSGKLYKVFFVVKQGKPNMKELEGLGRDIGDKWKILGRRLKVSEELEIIDAQYNILSEKAFQMLKHWTQKRGSSATYRVLSGALKVELLERKDLSEKYCYG